MILNWALDIPYNSPKCFRAIFTLTQHFVHVFGMFTCVVFNLAPKSPLCPPKGFSGHLRVSIPFLLRNENGHAFGGPRIGLPKGIVYSHQYRSIPLAYQEGSSGIIGIASHWPPRRDRQQPQDPERRAAARRSGAAHWPLPGLLNCFPQLAPGTRQLPMPPDIRSH